MSEIYIQFRDSEGWKVIERAIIEELLNYKGKLAALPRNIENTKDPIAFTIKSVELATQIRTLEQVLEMPEEILKKLEEENKQ